MSHPQFDLERPFGSHLPDAAAQRWLTLSQHAPRNYFGQRLVALAQRRFLSAHGELLDVEVAGIRLRSQFVSNHTERKFIFTPQRFDRRERVWLNQMLPSNGVFVDVGANVGIYTLLAARRMTSKGRIVAMEPYGPLYQRLRFNVDLNRAANPHNWPVVDCLPVAVTDADGQGQLFINQRNLGESSLLAGRGGQAVTVICRPLLALIKEQGLARIDVLKIDIEGCEDAALLPFLEEAADSLLPRGMLIEDSRARWRHDLPAALRQRGYRLLQQAGRNLIYQR